MLPLRQAACLLRLLLAAQVTPRHCLEALSGHLHQGAGHGLGGGRETPQPVRRRVAGEVPQMDTDLGFGRQKRCVERHSRPMDRRVTCGTR